MFSNLIESDSHRGELRRRGSFIAATVGVYSILFLALGVVSIYAYDAHLDKQNLELVALITPVLPPDVRPPDAAPRPPQSGDNHQTYDIRRVAMDDVNHPENPPPNISTTPNTSLAVRHMPTFIGGRDENGSGPLGSAVSPGCPSCPGSGGGERVVRVDIETEPPPITRPTPAPTSQKTVLHISTLLNGRAASLPRPPYPPIARAAHASGNVTVQVLLDETGRVVSAHAVSGHVLLLKAAEQAALQARFTPTILNGQAMKVSGIINYNFMLQ
jgi:TonB family protein